MSGLPCWRCDALWWPTPTTADDWMPWAVAQAEAHGDSWFVLRQDTVGAVEVSSIFLGVGDPFECMVFGGALTRQAWRADTAAGILALHGGLVAQLLAARGER